MIEKSLVSTGWVGERLGHPRLRVVDGSMYLPNSGRDAFAEYQAAHIPGAVFFDLEASSDRHSPLPHMLPTPADFAERMSALGLDDADDIVVYDGSGANLSAARVWWMFRLFGHDRVAVLDGGLQQWRREGRPLQSGVTTRPRGQFTAQPPPSGAIRDMVQVLEASAVGQEQIVDMRSAGRFAGSEPEPRPGLRGGHIPNSLNLPTRSLSPPTARCSLLMHSGIDWPGPESIPAVLSSPPAARESAPAR